MSVIWVLPNAFGAGVKVSVPVIGSTAGPTAKSAGLVLPATTKVNACPLSSTGPALIALAQPATVRAPASSATVTSGPFVKPGASLTAVTVTVTATVFERPPSSSLTRYWATSVPLKFAAGVQTKLGCVPEIVPWPGCVVTTTVSVSAGTSVSLASSSDAGSVNGVSSSSCSVSPVATGAALATVSENVRKVDAPSSSVTVTVTGWLPLSA